MCRPCLSYRPTAPRDFPMPTIPRTLLGLLLAAGAVVAADPPADKAKPADKAEAPVRRRAKGEGTEATGPAAKEQSVAELIAALKGPDAKARRAAAQQLGGRGAKAAEAVPALTAALKDDKEPAV